MRLLRFVLSSMIIAISVHGTVLAQQPTNINQSFVVANTESDALIRIANEIERLKPLISEARLMQDPGRRYRFQYDWLLRDLERIKHGLEDAAIGSGDIGPRDVEPIRGAYQQ